MLKLAGRNVLVLGLGDTGLSMARYLARQGATLRVADSRAAPPMAGRLTELLPGTSLHTGPFAAHSFHGVDLIAISPGVDAREPLIRAAQSRGVAVVGDVELFGQALAVRFAAGGGPRIAGITGSNGKTTVTTLVGQMCRHAGLRTVVAGNIGLPVLDALADAEAQGFPEVFVLEVSSFQLETVSQLHLDAAVVLNVTEDHLDRYAHFSYYAAAKARIYANARIRIANRDDPVTLAMVDPGAWTFGLAPPAGDTQWGLAAMLGKAWLARGVQPLMALDRLQIIGRHNAANALAALAVCSALGLPPEPLVDALEAFKGLPHRVERVAEINGVTWYDDSKGTNVGATVAALRGFDQPVVLIAGGDGKGQDFSPLNDVVAVRARAVVLIGRDAPLIESAICNSRIDVHHAATMDEAVQLAAKLALSGDAVLLSPACASFDMFRNYIHRAEAFCAAVRALPGAATEDRRVL